MELRHKSLWVTNLMATPLASSQTVALCHSHKPKRSLALQRHNPDAAGSKIPQFGCSTHWTRDAFFQAKRLDDLCIHYLRGTVHLGLFFSLWWKDKICPISVIQLHIFLPCLMKAHYESTRLGKEMGARQYSSSWRFCFSHEKKSQRQFVLLIRIQVPYLHFVWN